MTDDTKIEWADATWNPLVGCTKVSPGCDNCYAETLVNRFAGTNSGFPNRFDVVTMRDSKMLTQPLRWREPKRIFVNSLSDLFHKDVPEMFIARVFAVMALAPRHTFQLLTKRHGRMRALLNDEDFIGTVAQTVVGWTVEDGTDLPEHLTGPDLPSWWPLPNVHLGVSVEDQHWTIRIDALRRTPAAVRWVSAEPLLGPLTLHRYLPNGSGEGARWNPTASRLPSQLPTLDWVVAGGESGTGARPMHADWARTLRDQCVAAGVPFLFKQWGNWAPLESGGVRFGDVCLSGDGTRYDVDRDYVCAPNESEGAWMRRTAKKAAGRVLDGRVWDEYPAMPGVRR